MTLTGRVVETPMGSTIDSMSEGGYWVCDREHNCRAVLDCGKPRNFCANGSGVPSAIQSSDPADPSSMPRRTRVCVSQSMPSKSAATVRRVIRKERLRSLLERVDCVE